MEKYPCYAECVAYALHQRGISENDFENTSLRVYHRQVANPGSVFKALRKGAIVIPCVNASLFGQEPSQQVATWLMGTDDAQQQVRLYDPLSRQECQKTVAHFTEAWIAAGGGRCTTAFEDDGTYQPKLIDLAHVELPSDLDELMEAMAENAHDMWALERQSEGWSYGPERNDQLLQTPDMVPYEQLSESEREYDRIMAKDTLRLLMALGYKIVKND